MITAIGARTKTASDSQRQMLRRERKKYAAARPTTPAARPTATMARLFSPAKTSRITIARPASTKLRRASQRWADALFGPFMVGSSAVNGLCVSPGAGWLGRPDVPGEEDDPAPGAQIFTSRIS